MQLADAALAALGLHARRREDERPVEMFIYPGAYHLKWRPQQILAAQEHALAWIDFWMQGIERVDPNDPTRVERRRQLRALATH